MQNDYVGGKKSWCHQGKPKVVIKQLWWHRKLNKSVVTNHLASPAKTPQVDPLSPVSGAEEILVRGGPGSEK